MNWRQRFAAGVALALLATSAPAQEAIQPARPDPKSGSACGSPAGRG